MKAAEEQEPGHEKDSSVRVVDRRWWARGETPGADEPAVRKPTYVEDLEARLNDATAQLQRVMSDHRRSLEEFEQVKARLRRDVARDVERGRRQLLADLLEVLDNLDRALTTAGPAAPARPEGPRPDELESFVRGVALVRDQFLGKLGGFGVTRVPAADRPFDALKHEAVGTAPVDDPARDGVVVAVIKEGYAIGDEVLRPAAVVVGKHNP